MNLLSSVQKFFKPILERKTPPVPASPMNQRSGLQRDVTPGLEKLNIENVRRDRHSMYTEVRSMVENDPRWDRIALQVVKRCGLQVFRCRG